MQVKDVRAIDSGGVVFEDDKPDTLVEAMAALEMGWLSISSGRVSSDQHLR